MNDKITMLSEEMELEKIRIFNMINNIKENKPIESEKSIKKINKFKLYLNNLINLFNNKKERKIKPSLIQRLKVKIKQWWINESTETIKDLVKFIIIHGFMGMNTVLCLLTMSNVNISLINIIKQNVLLTCLVYLIGTGSAYYLLLDGSKALASTWHIYVGKEKR